MAHSSTSAWNRTSSSLSSSSSLETLASSYVTSSLETSSTELHENTVTEFTTSPVSIATTKIILVGLLLSAFILFAIAGNALVIVAILTDRHLRKTSNFFLVSLAVADALVAALVMTFAVVNDVMERWPFGPVFCNIWQSADIMCSTASILHLSAVSLDRYICVRNPLHYDRLVTHCRSMLAIALIWIMSALLSFLPIHLGWHRLGLGTELPTSDLSAHHLTTAPPATNHSTLARALMDRHSDDVTGYVLGDVTRDVLHDVIVKDYDVTNVTVDGDVLLYTKTTYSDSMLEFSFSTSPSFNQSEIQCQLELNQWYAVISSLVSFYIPCVIMIAIYWKLYKYAMSHVRSMNEITMAGGSQGGHHGASRGSVTGPGRGSVAGPQSGHTRVSLGSLLTDRQASRAGNKRSQEKRSISSSHDTVTPLTVLKPADNYLQRPPQKECGLAKPDAKFLSRESATLRDINDSQSRDATLEYYSENDWSVGRSSENSHPLIGCSDNTCFQLKHSSQTTLTKTVKGKIPRARMLNLTQKLRNPFRSSERSSSLSGEEGISRGVTNPVRNWSNCSSSTTGASRDGTVERTREGTGEGTREGMRKGTGDETTKGMRERPRKGTNDETREEQREAVGESATLGSTTDDQLLPRRSLTDVVDRRRYSPVFDLPTVRRGTGTSGALYSSYRRGAAQSSEHKAAITLGIIMGVFLFCWMPFFTINIISAFYRGIMPPVVFSVFTWLGYMNSTMNPVIYGVFNQQFRRAFKRVLARYCCSACCGRSATNRYCDDREISYACSQRRRTTFGEGADGGGGAGRESVLGGRGCEGGTVALVDKQNGSVEEGRGGVEGIKNGSLPKVERDYMVVKEQDR